MKKLRIFGAGVRASVVVDLISWHFRGQIAIEGFYDDLKPVGTSGPGGFPVLGSVPDGIKAMAQDQQLSMAFVAFGTRTSARRCEVFQELRDHQVRLLSLISPTSHVSPSACIGDNALILPGVFVGCGANVGHLLCAQGGAIIEHHSRIGHNVLFGPNVAVAGCVNIGSHVFLGSGCAVIPETTVGCGTILGAGSVVVRDIPAYVIAYGKPAQVMREVRTGDEVPVPAEVEKLCEIGFGKSL